MPAKEILHFNESKFAASLRSSATASLAAQEVALSRSKLSSRCAILTAAATAVASHGTSLIGAAIGARKASVAKRKLCLVREELRRRGARLHDKRKRDVLLPVGASLIGFGVAEAVGDVAGHVTDAVFEGVDVPHIASVHAVRGLGDALMDDPGHAVGTVFHGGGQHAVQMGHYLLDGSVDANCLPASSSVDTVWFRSGMGVAEFFEGEAGGHVGEGVAEKVLGGIWDSDEEDRYGSRSSRYGIEDESEDESEFAKWLNRENGSRRHWG